MVLVTGPTGSGKTTTLYSALSELNKIAHNIITAEDPVEYNLHGINQVQVHDEIGLTFAAALRAFLRQDPDIIMVGEIRDFETAEIAVKAALTGPPRALDAAHERRAGDHLAAPQHGRRAVPRDGERQPRARPAPRAQDLPGLQEPMKYEKQDPEDCGFAAEQIATAKISKGAGCRNCNGSGYKGRVALYEVMRFTDNLKEIVLQGASTAEIESAEINNSMRPSA